MNRMRFAARPSAAGAASITGRLRSFAGRLILHGRYVCKACKPDCPRCVIRDLCRFTGKTAQG